jgi:hypothetical protein
VAVLALNEIEHFDDVRAWFPRAPAQDDLERALDCSPAAGCIDMWNRAMTNAMSWQLWASAMRSAAAIPLGGRSRGHDQHPRRCRGAV